MLVCLFFVNVLVTSDSVFDLGLLQFMPDLQVVFGHSTVDIIPELQRCTCFRIIYLEPFTYETPVAQLFKEVF